MKNKSVILAISIGVVLFVWMAVSIRNDYMFRGGIKFQDQQKQEFVLQKMRERGLPYKLDNHNPESVKH